MSSSFTMFGPSDGALSGSSCVSMNTPRNPHRHSGARQRRHKGTVSAGGLTLPAWLLHAVRCIKHNRATVFAIIGSARKSFTNVL